MKQITYKYLQKYIVQGTWEQQNLTNLVYLLFISWMSRRFFNRSLRSLDLCSKQSSLMLDEQFQPISCKCRFSYIRFFNRLNSKMSYELVQIFVSELQYNPFLVHVVQVDNLKNLVKQSHLKIIIFE